MASPNQDSIFGGPSSGQESSTEQESPVAQLAAILDDLIAVIPEHEHLTDFELALAAALGTFIKSKCATLDEVVAMYRPASRWFMFLKEERLNCWMRLETEIANSVREGRPRAEMEMDVRALVAGQFGPSGDFDEWAVGINENIPEADFGEYLAAVAIYYQTKGQVLLEESILFWGYLDWEPVI